MGNTWLKDNFNRPKQIKGAAQRLAVLRSRALRAGLEVTLTLEEFEELCGTECSYCGGNLPATGSGIDRINSSIGYIKSNCRACCGTCNRAKSDMTEAEFRAWVCRVYSNWASA